MNQMERNERSYRDALDSLCFSEAAKERMMNNLINRQKPEQTPAKRKNFYPLQSGLVAACLCLALVGTAFAATAVYRLAVQIGDWDDEHVGYQVYGEPAIHPLEDFSQELQDDFAAWDDPRRLFYQEFGTFQEAKAYLGDNIPAVWHNIENTSEDEFPVQYTVFGYHEMYGDNKLQEVSLRENSVILGNMLSFYTEMTIFTPDWRGESLAGFGMLKGTTDFQSLENYTMANGCVAEVVVGTTTEESLGGDTHHYTGAFMRDGILYSVYMFAPIECPLNEAQMEAQLHQILDSFE